MRAVIILSIFVCLVYGVCTGFAHAVTIISKNVEKRNFYTKTGMEKVLYYSTYGVTAARKGELEKKEDMAKEKNPNIAFGEQERLANTQFFADLVRATQKAQKKERKTK